MRGKTKTQKPAVHKSNLKWNDIAWESSYKDLVAFKDEHDHFDPPPSHELYKWVLLQRDKFEKEKLPDSQWGKIAVGQTDQYLLMHTFSHVSLVTFVFLERLNDIGFNFVSNDPIQMPEALKSEALNSPKQESMDRGSYLENLWDKSYRELRVYKTHFGHCNIPIAYKANPSLGAWAFSQRMANKRGKLSEERIEKLNDLGFEFKQNPSSGTSGSKPDLSVISLKNLPPHVKPLLRDPNLPVKKGHQMYKYLGICRQLRKNNCVWQSQVSFDGVNHYLGTFKSEKDAAAIYAWAHLILYGEEATKEVQRLGEEATAVFEQKQKDKAEGMVPPPSLPKPEEIEVV